MKKVKGKKIKLVWIVLGVIFGLAVLIGGGIFFVFGEDAVEAVDSFVESTLRGEDPVVYDDDPESEVPFAGSGGGGGGGGGGGSGGGG